ncbi:NADH-quinone oxidoreductase subunit C [Ectothiorhodospiraceae bacterium BW-2]|nr:NADH-quinone oxidoreductase subunit C [Ectothiorhodospiraceae bacterium BW-2]
MSDYYLALSESVSSVLGELCGERVVAHRELTVTLSAATLLAAMTRLRDDEALKFEQLIDLCGVDYLDYHGKQQLQRQGRFAVVYHLQSISLNHRLRVRCFCEEEAMPLLPSVTTIWSCADWFEREAFDLYGILFEGHPDLRRILTDYGFIGHPFRKDFPISGHVEMRYDEQKQRVVYQPVTIDPRDQIPKVVREDHRYLSPAAEEAKNG